MNKVEKWIVKKIIRKEVKQDFDHHLKIADLYALIRECCEEEFTEDNAPTLDDALREWFESTQYEDKYNKGN
jgi:hypothetical protein